jgi:hypothetical protein
MNIGAIFRRIIGLSEENESPMMNRKKRRAYMKRFKVRGPRNAKQLREEHLRRV